ncbi:MAG: Holliday junction branch migration protein RuvA [Coraliomargarita sp. TMED73]|nr:MAG: Holliday junction branch migration protein RuvA [Coraliomargarita sp. TMED73]
MISQIKGTLLEATPLSAIIQAGGLGYEVHVPVTTAEKLPATGKECQLFIHAVYREDSATLYGFATREDRDFFRLLVERVSGIGPKIGIAILSRMSVELLRSAIAGSDVALLSQCPGIGKKTAERLIIELRDKVFTDSPGSTGLPGTGAAHPPAATHFQDAVASLITLGYKPAEADKLVRKASAQAADTATTEELLRLALG